MCLCVCEGASTDVVSEPIVWAPKMVIVSVSVRFVTKFVGKELVQVGREHVNAGVGRMRTLHGTARDGVPVPVQAGLTRVFAVDTTPRVERKIDATVGILRHIDTHRRGQGPNVRSTDTILGVLTHDIGEGIDRF
jgi:uncharacterized protein (DUF111 family)